MTHTTPAEKVIIRFLLDNGPLTVHELEKTIAARDDLGISEIDFAYALKLLISVGVVQHKLTLSGNDRIIAHLTDINPEF